MNLQFTGDWDWVPAEVSYLERCGIVGSSMCLCLTIPNLICCQFSELIYMFEASQFLSVLLAAVTLAE